MKSSNWIVHVSKAGIPKSEIPTLSRESVVLGLSCWVLLQDNLVPMTCWRKSEKELGKTAKMKLCDTVELVRQQWHRTHESVTQVCCALLQQWPVLYPGQSIRHHGGIRAFLEFKVGKAWKWGCLTKEKVNRWCLCRWYRELKNVILELQQLYLLERWRNFGVIRHQGREVVRRHSSKTCSWAHVRKAEK